MKNAIEQMWQHIYTTGVNDILMGLDLVSSFFILKFLEERSLRREDTMVAEACRWSQIKQMASVNPYECCQHLRTHVSTWLRAKDPESCLADTIQAFIQVQPHVIYRFMDALDMLCEEYVSMQDAFEAVLLWAEKEGAFQPKAGQIMTPMHIAYLMADLVRPQADECVIDVSCGTGNLLVAARQHMQCGKAISLLDNGRALFDEQIPSRPLLKGFDFNPMLLLPCYTHLLLSGVDMPSVHCSDALGSIFHQRMTEQAWGAVDVVLLNPPYSGFVDRADLGKTLQQIGTSESELLFAELTLQLLREGGRACLLVPEGILRNGSRACHALRKKLIQNHQLKAVVSLPQGIFLPQSNIKTSLLLFHKGGQTGEDVFFYRVSSDGYTLDARREATSTNDLWDLRLQLALAQGLPNPVPGLLDPALWEKYSSGSWYFQPKVRSANPATRDRVPQITSIEALTSTAERSWFVSVEEIQASNYSLCADTYRSTMSQTKRRQ